MEFQPAPTAPSPNRLVRFTVSSVLGPGCQRSRVRRGSWGASVVVVRRRPGLGPAVGVTFGPTRRRVTTGSVLRRPDPPAAPRRHTGNPARSRAGGAGMIHRERYRRWPHRRARFGDKVQSDSDSRHMPPTAARSEVVRPSAVLPRRFSFRGYDRCGRHAALAFGVDVLFTYRI